MYLKIIGDPQEAAKKMGTNVPLRANQLISTGNQGKVLAQKYPELFDFIDDKGLSYQEMAKKQYKTKEDNFKPQIKEDKKEESEEFKPQKTKRKKRKWL